MPCWTVKKTSVNVSAMQPVLLAEGLKAAGFTVKLDGETVIFSRIGEYLYHTYHKGHLTLVGNDFEGLTNEVKRAYSAQAVRHAASQFGWKLNEPKPQQFAAIKRR